VGTKQGPVPISQHPLHKQVGDPEALEQVACSLLVLAVVLLELQELHDVHVPRFQLDSEGSHAFAPALGDLSCGVVEDLEHGDDACRVAPGALDEGSLGTDVADRESDAARVLADDSTLLEGLLDTLDAVLLHGQQEAG